MVWILSYSWINVWFLTSFHEKNELHENRSECTHAGLPLGTNFVEIVQMTEIMFQIMQFNCFLFFFSWYVLYMCGNTLCSFPQYALAWKVRVGKNKQTKNCNNKHLTVACLLYKVSLRFSLSSSTCFWENTTSLVTWVLYLKHNKTINVCKAVIFSP